MKAPRSTQTLGDLGRSETRSVCTHLTVKTALANSVQRGVFEDRVHQLDERLSRLETRFTVETTALVARCEVLEKELAALKGVVRTVDTKSKRRTIERREAPREAPKEPVPPAPPCDMALLGAFSTWDMEVVVRGLNSLKQWTGRSVVTPVYDSTRDPFTDDGLFDRIRGKNDVAVVGFTTDGDVFGGFYSVAVTKQGQDVYDPTIFAFSFESHGRCTTPQRFAVQEPSKNKARVCFNAGSPTNGFVFFGTHGGFGLGNEECDAWCQKTSSVFAGLEDTTLTGKTGTWSGPFHHCARIIAVQLE